MMKEARTASIFSVILVEYTCPGRRREKLADSPLIPAQRIPKPTADQESSQSSAFNRGAEQFGIKSRHRYSTPRCQRMNPPKGKDRDIDHARNFQSAQKKRSPFQRRHPPVPFGCRPHLRRRRRRISHNQTARIPSQCLRHRHSLAALRTALLVRDQTLGKNARLQRLNQLILISASHHSHLTSIVTGRSSPAACRRARKSSSRILSTLRPVASAISA